jgi:hypothetical protein
MTQLFQNPYLSVLPKTQRNRAVLLLKLSITLWRSAIHINLKIDADPLNRRWLLFCVRRTIYRNSQGQYACKCASVYGICSVQNKIENESNPADSTSNLIWPKLTQTLQILTSENVVYRKCIVIKLKGVVHRSICAVYVEIWEDRLYYLKHNGIAHCYFENASQLYGEAKFISV